MPGTRHLRPLAFLSMLTATAGLLVTGGCGSGARTASTEQPASSISTGSATSKLDRDAWSRLGYRHIWTGFATVSEGDHITSFEIFDDGLLLQDSSSVVTSLSPTSGEIKWASPVASPLTRFVGMTREGNRYIVCSESEAFFLAADSGTLLAKQRFARVVNTRPVINGSLLIMGTSSGEVLGHLLSGFKAWGYAVGGSFEANPIPIGGDYVGLVSQNGRVIIIMPVSGSAASQYRVYSGLACDPAASDKMLFVAALDQSIYGFEIFGTQPKWRKRTDTQLKTTPTYANGRLYVEVPTSGLLCLEAETGKEIWTAKNISGTVIATQHGKLVVWNGSEAVVLDPANGDVVSKATLSGIKTLKTDRFADGNMYAVTPEGAVHKFEIK